jgi:hypothetical protein
MVMRISRKPSPITDHDRSEITKQCEIFQLFGQHDNTWCNIYTWNCHGKSSIQDEDFFTSKLDLNLRKKLVNSYIWSIALYDAETWTLRKVDQKYLEISEMWCWRRIKISRTDRVRNVDVLHIVKDRNILHTMKRREADWIGHVLRIKGIIEARRKWQKDNEEDVSSYWMAVRKREDIVNWKGKH